MSREQRPRRKERPSRTCCSTVTSVNNNVHLTTWVRTVTWCFGGDGRGGGGNRRGGSSNYKNRMRFSIFVLFKVSLQFAFAPGASSS